MASHTGMDPQQMDTNTAAAILSQFDHNTQMQALTMLRQLNAQQQFQQLQQLQQFQQLQALQALHGMQGQGQVQPGFTTEATHVTPRKSFSKAPLKRVVSTASRPAKELSQSNSMQSIVNRRDSAVSSTEGRTSEGSSRNAGSRKQSNASHITKNSTSSKRGSLMIPSTFNKRSSVHLESSVTTKLGQKMNALAIEQAKNDASLPASAFLPREQRAGPDGELFDVPSDDMIDQIVIASEYYFSDENLTKDHYLLRQICQKSEGYLSVKLLTALKNVKRLTKDWRVTGYSLERSSKLLLNAEKSKVKRIAALPEVVLKARQITSVIAIRIPMEFSSVSSITQLFAQFGKITLVRVLLPGRQVPCDLRNYATQVPDMGSSLCAVVEYETEEEACIACRELNLKRYSSGLRSALLGPRLRRNLYKMSGDGAQEATISQTGQDQQSINRFGQGRKPSFNGNTREKLNSKFSGLATTNNAWNKAVVVNGLAVASKYKAGPSDGKSSSGISSNGASSGPYKAKQPLQQRKSVKMQININSNSAEVFRQPKGPNGCGFYRNRDQMVHAMKESWNTTRSTALTA